MIFSLVVKVCPFKLLLLAYEKSLGFIARSLYFISNGRISLLLLAVLVEKDHDKDSYGNPNDHANGNEASFGSIVVIMRRDIHSVAVNGGSNCFNCGELPVSWWGHGGGLCWVRGLTNLSSCAWFNLRPFLVFLWQLWAGYLSSWDDEGPGV